MWPFVVKDFWETITRIGKVVVTFLPVCGVQVGAWGCFDEFNRLEERMLSAVSQQVQTIQEALKEKAGSSKSAAQGNSWNSCCVGIMFWDKRVVMKITLENYNFIMNFIFNYSLVGAA